MSFVNRKMFPPHSPFAGSIYYGQTVCHRPRRLSSSFLTQSHPATVALFAVATKAACRIFLQKNPPRHENRKNHMNAFKLTNNNLCSIIRLSYYDTVCSHCGCLRTTNGLEFWYLRYTKYLRLLTTHTLHFWYSKRQLNLLILRKLMQNLHSFISVFLKYPQFLTRLYLSKSKRKENFRFY